MVILMMSSGISWLRLGNYHFLAEGLRYKLEVWLLKHVGIYKARKIKDY